MLMVFRTYGAKATVWLDEKGWIETSHWVATAWNQGASYAAHLRKWCWAFMEGFETLPMNIYGHWKSSILLADEDLKQEIQTYL
jgi:hypothetical protein